MKIKLFLVLTLALLVIGCTAEGDIQVQETMELEDQVVFEDEETTIEIVDAQLEVTTQVVDEVSNLLGSVSIDDWCIPGSTYSYESEGASVDSNIVGITTKNGQTVCRAGTSQVMEIPYMGTIEIKTEYYISEDQTEIWVVVDSMGQVEEMYVNLKQ
jgi:uncharacterized protein YcfL